MNTYLLERVAGDVRGRQGEDEGRGGAEGPLLGGEVRLPDEGHVEVERAPDPLRGAQRVHGEVLAARDVPDPEGHRTPPNGDTLRAVHIFEAPDCLSSIGQETMSHVGTASTLPLHRSLSGYSDQIGRPTV